MRIWYNKNTHIMHYTEKYPQPSSISWPVSACNWAFVLLWVRVPLQSQIYDITPISSKVFFDIQVVTYCRFTLNASMTWWKHTDIYVQSVLLPYQYPLRFNKDWYIVYWFIQSNLNNYDTFVPFAYFVWTEKIILVLFGKRVSLKLGSLHKSGCYCESMGR